MRPDLHFISIGTDLWRLPDIVLSVLVAPLIDKGGKKKWIVGLDIVTAVLYAVMGLYISGHAFNYLLYLIFVLAVGTISVFTVLHMMHGIQI